MPCEERWCNGLTSHLWCPVTYATQTLPVSTPGTSEPMMVHSCCLARLDHRTPRGLGVWDGGEVAFPRVGAPTVHPGPTEIRMAEEG